MKPKILFVIFLGLLFWSCSSQSRSYLKETEVSKSENKTFNIYDEFNDNRNNWYESKGADHEINISNGYYNIENKTLDSSRMVWKDIDFKKDRLYLAEVNIRYYKGFKKSGFGIYIELKNEERLVILINNINELTYYYENQVEVSPILDWTEVDIINPDNWNKFNFILEDKKGVFYLNDYEIGNFRLEENPIKRIGFIVDENLKVNIDYIHLVEEEKLKI